MASISVVNSTDARPISVILMKSAPSSLTNLCLALIGSLLAVVGCGPIKNGNRAGQTLILATTTSTQDSGLLDVLIPQFHEQSDHNVQTIAVGTGAALKMAESGNADVLLVHAPSAEQRLMDSGVGKDRLLVMHNDFVIVGPATDPANVASQSCVADALSQIAAKECLFVSRGDDSGTHKRELSIWESTQFSPHNTSPSWYLETGQGMGASLIVAFEKGAYTLTDHGTWMVHREVSGTSSKSPAPKGEDEQNSKFKVLFRGDPALLNVYHVITVNPDKWPATNYKGALAFAEFITGLNAQSAIAAFGMETHGQPLFFPDAGKSEADLAF